MDNTTTNLVTIEIPAIGPYFAYSAASPKGHIQPTDTNWPEVLPAVNTAKSEMVRRTRCYAEVPDSQLSVTRLKVFAWVTAGIKKVRRYVRLLH